MRYILTVDIGTTSLKSVVYDEHGQECGAKLCEYKTLTPNPGWAEMEVHTYLAAFEQGIKGAIAGAGISPDEILTLVFSTQGETTVVLDELDQPLRNAIVWLDTRASEEASGIVRHFGAKEIQERTGQVGEDAIWPGAKLLWLRKHEPEVFKKMRRIVQLEGYFSLLLTGIAAGEDSILGSSIYFDIQKRCWWKESLDFIGIAEEQLPLILKPGEAVGTITEEAAKRFHLSTKTIVNIGAIDLGCGAVGVGNVRPGAFSDVTGSALCTMTMTDRIILDPTGQMPCYCSAVPGMYMVHAYSAGGLCLRWFRDAFELIGTEEKNVYDLMDDLAADVLPGAEGLIALPHLQGSGPPDLAPNAKGVFFGVTLAHEKKHFIRALMEGVAMVLVRIIDRTEALGIDVERITALGGGAKSPVWCQIKADAAGREVVTMSGSENACCLGAAILAGTEAGIWESVAQAAELLIKEEQHYYPDPNHTQAYKDLLEQYRTLMDCLQPMFR